MWKEVEGFSNYEINKSGTVKSKRTKRIMKFGWRGSRGGKYPYINLKRDDGKFVKQSVHRMVAVAYVPNPDNKPEVNHIDTDHGNFHYTNLEWHTRSENMKHCFKNYS